LSAFIRSWDWDPTIIGALVVTAVLYLVGWRQLHLRAHGKRVLPAWRVWCLLLGLASVCLALLSPIAVYSQLFFFMHMIQHLLLILVAAPLLLLGAPLLPVLWALPAGARVRLGRLFSPGLVQIVFNALTHPMVAVTVYCAVLAFWHLPPFYDAAQGRTAIHDLEHALFLGSSLLLWWPAIHPAGGRRRLSYTAGVVYFLPPMLVGSLIGALLTFAERPLYATYQHVPRVWGISVVQDQQLAGLIMWVPGGLVFLVPVFIFLVLLLNGPSSDPAPAGEGETTEDGSSPTPDARAIAQEENVSELTGR
jgi:putative membrane protein